MLQHAKYDIDDIVRNGKMDALVLKNNVIKKYGRMVIKIDKGEVYGI